MSVHQFKERKIAHISTLTIPIFDQDKTFSTVSPISITNAKARTHFNFYAVADSSSNNNHLHKLAQQIIDQNHYKSPLTKNKKMRTFMATNINPRFKIHKGKTWMNKNLIADEQKQLQDNSMHTFSYFSKKQKAFNSVKNDNDRCKQKCKSVIPKKLGHLRTRSIDKTIQLLGSNRQKLLSPPLKNLYAKRNCKTPMNKMYSPQSRETNDKDFSSQRNIAVLNPETSYDNDIGFLANSFLVSRKKLGERGTTITKMLNISDRNTQPKDEQILKRIESITESKERHKHIKDQELIPMQLFTQKQIFNDIQPWDNSNVRDQYID